MGFVLFSELTVIISLNNINYLIFGMVAGFVFFAALIEVLNT
jgi:hypothetical protein